jgi:hypothetical protein
VLFQTVSKGRLYPAKVITKSGEHITLVWHSGNVYMSGEEPASPTFSRTVAQCSDALRYSHLDALSQFGVRLGYLNYMQLLTRNLSGGHHPLATEAAGGGCVS